MKFNINGPITGKEHLLQSVESIGAYGGNYSLPLCQTRFTGNWVIDYALAYVVNTLSMISWFFYVKRFTLNLKEVWQDFSWYWLQRKQ